MTNTHKHTANCRHLLDQVSDYIDGELEANLCAELEKHLADCDNCSVLVDTLHKTVLIYQKDYQQNQVTLSNEVTARLWEALDEAGCVNTS